MTGLGKEIGRSHRHFSSTEHCMPSRSEAMNAIEDVMACMRAAPDDFGGNRAEAIADC
jgi:hypothetical protein